MADAVQHSVASCYQVYILNAYRRRDDHAVALDKRWEDFRGISIVKKLHDVRLQTRVIIRSALALTKAIIQFCY